MYKSKNIENAVSTHKMGFRTSCLAYIMRGLYDISLGIILIIFSLFMQGTFDVEPKAIFL